MTFNTPVDIFRFIKEIEMKMLGHGKLTESSLCRFWNGSPEHVRNKMVGMWNLLNSHVVSEDCLKSYIYDLFIENIFKNRGKIIANLNENTIQKYDRKVFKNQRQRDKNFIRLFLSKQKMAENDLFKVGESGLSPATMLLEKGYISPFVLSDNMDKMTYPEKSNDIQKKITKLATIIREVN